MPHGPHHHGFDSADHADRLELEAAAAAGIDAAAIDRCRALLDGVAVRRVADLGSGPGVAAAALAQAFPDATVVAVDGAPAMLERAAARGLRTARLDLDGDLAELGEVQLAWASMAVHHAADEGAALARLAALLAPGGVLCVLDRAAPTTVRVPGDDGGRPGLWDRVDAVRATRWQTLPGAPDGYGAALRDAGLEVVEDTTLQDAPGDDRGPAVARFAADRLRREAGGLADHLDAADAGALARIAGAEAIPGAEVRISRRLLLARRPA